VTTNTEPRPDYSWFAHPARERAGRAVAGLAVIAAMAVLSAVLMQSAWWGGFAALVLVLALNRFYFRSRFVIDDEGITAAYLLRRQRMRWAELRRFVCDDAGAYLSTRARRSWLDAYRGLHVLFGRHRHDVVEHLRAHLPDGGTSWAR
jgi:hypothetical protein